MLITGVAFNLDFYLGLRLLKRDDLANPAEKHISLPRWRMRGVLGSRNQHKAIDSIPVGC